MKLYFSNFILLTFFTGTICQISKSFLKFDPIQSLVFVDPTNLLRRSPFFFEILPFYIKNTSKASITEYFLPFSKCSLLTAENNSPDASIRDVNAIHLNIDFTNNLFDSITSFRPEYKNVGLLMHINSFFRKRFWVDAILPFSRLQTNMNLSEDVINTGQGLVSGAVSNVTEAFKQSSWNYGKIDGARCKGGLNDIDCKIGSTFETLNFSAYPFIGIIIPTGNKPTSEYVFEPIIGNTKHFAVRLGIINFYQPCPDECIQKSPTFYLDFDFFYSFKNTQNRILDLIDKDWSRYMIVYTSRQDALKAFDNAGNPAAGDKGQPGINSFTQKVIVSPGISFQSTFRMWFIKNCLKNEFGLSVYFKERERICLNCNNNFNSIALVGTAGSGTTTDARTINYNYVGTKTNNMEDDRINEGTYASLTNSDFNLDSASTPASLSLTLFYKIQYFYKEFRFNLATSYKFSVSSNVPPNLISIWGGLTYDF